MRRVDVDVRDAFVHRILGVDQAVSVTAASLHVPDPAPINDANLAASALVHRLNL